MIPGTNTTYYRAKPCAQCFRRLYDNVLVCGIFCKQYRSIADKIVENLSQSYRSPLGENKGFLLLHSTGSKPANSEVDVPINYADYYYLEALLRAKKLKEKKSLF